MMFFDRISIEAFEAAPKTVHLVAALQDLDLIATRLKVPALKAISGRLVFERRGPDIQVTGSVDAMLQRTCTISLEPMSERIEDTFQLRLTSEFLEEDAVSEEDVDLIADFVDEANKLAPAEILIQQVALAMAAHPKLPDAEPPAPLTDKSSNDNPFAALAGLVATKSEESGR